jgi:hypothetical protein
MTPSAPLDFAPPDFFISHRGVRTMMSAPARLLCQPHFRLALLALPLLAGGCQLVGVLAYKLTPPPTIQPKYTSLAGQSVGVMVWSDRGIRIEWPGAALDLANSVQAKFKALQEGKKPPKQLEGTTFPVQPASILRYQRDHPEIEAMPITEVAPRFGVKRLIYVELEEFATRSEASVQLFRGVARATVRVIEISPDGKASAAFEQNNVGTAFPPKAPPEGIPGAGDQRIYVGTIDALATEIVHLFVPYQLEE